MIYLHTDTGYRTDQWYRRFEYLLQQQQLRHRKINLLRKDYRKLKVEGGDALIGRFGHVPSDLARMKPIYGDLAAEFSGRIFPAELTYAYYDDKRAQLALFKNQSYPTPRAASVVKDEDVDRFLEETGLRFPLVTKKYSGAGPSNVRLANNREEVFRPGILQECCFQYDRGMRLYVIGDRVMGYWRLNPADDFLASGSSTLVYTDKLDSECMDLVYGISRDLGFESMGYDLVRDKKGCWVALEMSYAYPQDHVKECPFYYDMRTKQKVGKQDIYPQDFILEDFLLKHPLVLNLAKPVCKVGRFANLWSRREHRSSRAGNGQIPYELNVEVGAMNIELKLERQKKGGVFEWPNIVELDRLASMYSEGKNVLDIGCGTGCAAEAMAKNASHVTAIEPDTATLEWAKQNRPADNIVYLNMLSGELTADDQFDLITSIDVMEHVRDYHGLILDMVRMLKPDGMVLVTTPNRLRDDPPKLRPVNPCHVLEYSPSDLYFIFNMFFDDVRLFSLKDTYDHRTMYPIDINSRATPLIVLALNPKKSRDQRASSSSATKASNVGGTREARDSMAVRKSA